MSRPVPEWIGKDETTPVPGRVWGRILDRHGWRCASCRRDYTLVKSFEKDHTVALINWSGDGHGNRESNLQPLCDVCHGDKTKVDVAEKARTARHKTMRPAYKRVPKRTGLSHPGKDVWRYNWTKRRYERVD